MMTKSEPFMALIVTPAGGSIIPGNKSYKMINSIASLRCLSAEIWQGAKT